MSLFSRKSSILPDAAPRPGLVGRMSADAGANAVRGAVEELANPLTQAALAAGAVGLVAAFTSEATASARRSAESKAADMGTALSDTASWASTRAQDAVSGALGSWFSAKPTQDASKA